MPPILKNEAAEESIPDSCLLEQVVRWLDYGVKPKPDDVYQSVRSSYSRIDPIIYFKCRKICLALREGRISAKGRRKLSADTVARLAKMSAEARSQALEHSEALSKEPIVISKDVWNFEDVDWDNSKIIEAENREPLAFFDYVGIRISTRDFQEVFPEVVKSPETIEYPTNAQPNLGKKVSAAGRIPQYKWDEFWVWVVKRIHDEGFPENPAELREEMAQWCVNNWDKQPSDSTLKAKVKALQDIWDFTGQ